MRKALEVFTSDTDLVTCLPWDEVGHSIGTEELT